MGSAGGKLSLKRRCAHPNSQYPVSSARESSRIFCTLAPKYFVMLVLPLACLAFLVQSSNPSPLPATHLKNGDYLEHMTEMEDTGQQKLNAPPYQCRAPPCTPSKVLHRAKRTIDIFPLSLLKVSLLGARLQIFPDAPFGANNFALFDFELKVPKELAFLVPGQG